jgi:hypothetical protein
MLSVGQQVLRNLDRVWDRPAVWSSMTSQLHQPGYVGVSINGGTPQWMVYIMENTIKMDDLGVPLQETSIYPSGQMFRGSPDNKTSRASSGSLGLGPLEESRFCVFHFCGSYL